jgi:hypothetical protein
MIQSLVNRRARVGVTEMRLKINIDVYIHPEKHLLRLPIEKIIADTKVHKQIVEFLQT